MIILRWPKDFRAVQDLPFCYLCGTEFIENLETDRDHVPPKSVFNPRDRQPPLKLKTHKSCNGRFSIDDKKIGQLIALRRGERPTSARDNALRLVHYPHLDMVALENLNVDAAIWRWVAGFHAALYRNSLVGARGTIQTPFPRADKEYGRVTIERILRQNLEFIDNIKRNRAHNNLDRLVSNNRKLIYECVWSQFDKGTRWFCMFALDIYDWKDLGSHTTEIPARGCTGFYELPDGSAPESAARDHARTIITPNYDIFDPFAP
jgi:hypothetical protein